MWKYIAAYLAAVFGGIFKHAGDDIRTDEYGMNQTDRDYIAYLKKQIQKGEMTEQEAMELFMKKGGTPEMWNAVNPTGDSLFGESAGTVGTTGSGIQDIFSSLLAYFTRNQLTGAEMQQNEWNAAEAQKSRDFTEYMARNKYQMETQSMRDAGVNPAMMYGGGNLVPTAANGATGQGSPLSGGNIGDLLSTLIRMPRELKLLDAEIKEKEANARLTEQKTQTEIQNTRIQSINADYQDALNDQTLQNMRATYDNTIADTDYKTANTDYVKTQRDAQITVNKYIDERQRAEIDQLKAHKLNLDANTAKTNAEKTYQVWYNNFVNANGFLPSSNDALMVATYIASLFGIAKENVNGWLNDLMNNLPDWFKPKNPKPGDNTPPGTSGSDVGGGSR